MKLKIYLALILIISSYSIYAHSKLMREMYKTYYPSIRLKDQRLTLREKLQKWFPKHQIISIDKKYYLTSPYFRDLRADFFIKNDVVSRRTSVIPDTTATFSDSTIVLNTGESIPAFNLDHKDFREIKNQIAWLNVLFRTIGTPIPELMLGNFDEVETYVIIYNNNNREMVIMPSFTETVKKINYYYENHLVYFEFEEVKKVNSRLEFNGKMFIRNTSKNLTDFIEVRFHTNRLNEIDLAMFIIHKNI